MPSGLEVDLGNRAIVAMEAKTPACVRYMLADEIVAAALPEKRAEAIAIAQDVCMVEAGDGQPP